MAIYSSFLRKTYWARDYLKGSPVRNNYKDIKSTMKNKAIGDGKRKKYLQDLLTFMTNNAPFYYNYKKKELCSFPVINKNVILENYSDLLVPPQKIPNQKGKVFVQKTSGSTGVPLAVPQNTNKRNRRIAELKYFGEMIGYKSHERLIHLRAWNRWQSKSKWQSLKENIIPFKITNLDEENLKLLCDTINRKKVTAIRGYASSLGLLSDYIIGAGIKVKNLKIAIAVSESLIDSTRENFSKEINCKIISQYSNEENGIIGQELLGSNRKNKFILNHASYFIEVLKMKEDKPAGLGELGRIVVTDLFNYAFPMIRYDTGDTGILLAGTKESMEYPILGALYGRRIDLVSNSQGEIIHPMALSRILKHYNNIKQWQFIQNGEKVYLLRMIINREVINKDEIEKDILSILGEDAEFTIEVTKNIPVLDSGKRKAVVNNWKY